MPIEVRAGAAALGAVGGLAIRPLAVKRGGIGSLIIEQVGRPRELIVDQEGEQEA